MPELPEIEAVARTLAPLIVGRQIKRCRVIHPIVVQASPGAAASHAPTDMAKAVKGQRVVAIERRAKYLILRLAEGCLVMHFRFDGQLIWFASGKTSGHIDVAFEMNGGALGFVDPRHLGRIQWASAPGAIPSLRSLGTEPLSRDFTTRALADLLAKAKKPLKVFLLDQTKIAGIGNIYSSEILWHARLDPRRPAKKLSGLEIQRLHKAIVGVLGRAIECCLHPAPDFHDPDWWFTGLDRILRVYGRAGAKCRRCGGTIARMAQAGRSSFWCPKCQK